MRQAPNVEFAACADVYLPNAERAREWAGPSAASYQDFRRVLERKDVDAVLVSTPDHWHAYVTVLACEAGKNVYVEKPLAHNIREGRAMVDAARRYNRIVQVGTQHRSAPHYREVQEIIQSGKLGEVHFVRVWNYFNMLPDGIGRVADSDVPPGTDWEMYLGPAPKRPYNAKRIGPTFRWFWDYAGGTITDFGVHRFDTVQQIMGVDTPLTVSASGGRYTLRDMGEMPDTLQVTWEYPGFVLSYESSTLNAHGLGGRTTGMRYYNMRGDEDRPHGEAYYGTKGTLFADRIGYEIFPEPGKAPRTRPQEHNRRHQHPRQALHRLRSRLGQNLRRRRSRPPRHRRRPPRQHRLQNRPQASLGRCERAIHGDADANKRRPASPPESSGIGQGNGLISMAAP